VLQIAGFAVWFITRPALLQGNGLSGIMLCGTQTSMREGTSDKQLEAQVSQQDYATTRASQMMMCSMASNCLDSPGEVGL